MMDDSEIRDEREDALWDLLGKARSVEASPFFARKVLRAVSDTRPVEMAWLRWLRMLAPAGACAALAVAVVFGAMQDAPVSVASSDTAAEFDTIANLDVLVADYESSLWINGYASLPPY